MQFQTRHQIKFKNDLETSDISQEPNMKIASITKLPQTGERIPWKSATTTTWWNKEMLNSVITYSQNLHTFFRSAFQFPFFIRPNTRYSCYDEKTFERNCLENKVKKSLIIFILTNSLCPIIRNCMHAYACACTCSAWRRSSLFFPLAGLSEVHTKVGIQFFSCLLQASNT